MKKKIALCMAAILSIGIIAGCAGKKEGDGDVLTWYVPGQKQTDIKAVMEEVNKIVEPEIGAKIDLQIIDEGSYSENMKMKMSAGEEFDLMFVGYVNNYITAVQLGGLLDITDLLDTHAPKLYDVVGDVILDQARVDERIYAIPNVQTMTLKSCIWIRADLAEEYGIDENKINHINDVEPFLEWCKQNHPEVYPFKNNTGVRPWTQVDYLYPEDGYVVDRAKLIAGEKNIDVIREVELPVYKDAVYKLWDWYQKGYIRKDILTVIDDSGDYKSGKYGAIYTPWKPGGEKNVKANAGADYIPVFLDKQNKPFVEGARNAMTGISNTSKNPEKAMKFIELINTNKDLYNMICFGIEGKHYTMNDKNEAVVIKNSGYDLSTAGWKFGCQFNLNIIEGQDHDIWTKTMELNEEGIKNPIGTFVFDNTKITSELASVATVYEQYAVTKVGAQNPDEYYDEMMTKLNNAGQKKIEDELEKQINEFLAKQ